MESLFRLLPGPQSVGVRYGITLVMVLLTLAVHVGMQGRAGPYQFILFVPAIVASGLMFDRGTGFFALAVSAVLVGARLDWTTGASAHAASLVIFLIIGGGLVFVSEGLHRALERAHNAEREKDLLLQEMSHRVKNKFSMIVSMIALQSRQADGEAQKVLQSIDARVRVIANIHDYLQRSRHDGHVDMKEYLDGLCSSLGQAMIDRPIKLLVSVEQVSLPPEKALSAGLIVNELVTNALKYAFPDDRAGSVRVVLEARNGAIRLSVSDDGIGCVSPNGGLGTRLVKMIAAQQGGDAEWRALDPGCDASVSLPVART
jgi:two-component sensor histidine kinase